MFEFDRLPTWVAEAIAYASYGLDQFGVLAELHSDRADVNVDRALQNHRVIAGVPLLACPAVPSAQPSLTAGQASSGTLIHSLSTREIRCSNSIDYRRGSRKR